MHFRAILCLHAILFNRPRVILHLRLSVWNVHQLQVHQLPTLHCTVTGLTRERLVTLGLPSWTHFWTRYWGVFTLQGTRRFPSCDWPMVWRKLGNRWKWRGGSWFHHRKVFWNRRDVILFSVVRKITASRENRRELLGDEVMKTASHRIVIALLKWLNRIWTASTRKEMGVCF